jgi:hypothetical protein
VVGDHLALLRFEAGQRWRGSWVVSFTVFVVVPAMLEEM